MTKQVAITIKQPWVYSIFYLGKDIENRSWALPEKYEGQRVWIHAAKNCSLLELAAFYEFADSIGVTNAPFDISQLPFGVIVGSVKFSNELTHRSKWMMPSFRYWKISDAVLLSKPIPAKGKLGFWDCTNLVEGVA